MKEEDLIDYYQKEVDAIPEMRQLVSYSFEIKLECLKHLSQNCSKDQEFKELVGICMKHLQGKANPVIVSEVVDEWLDTE